MWNSRNLRPPPECRIKISLSDEDLDILSGVKSQIQHARSVVADQMEMLSAEHYILKRIVYKLINQMRRDKAIACLRQVNSCLKRLMEIKLETRLDTLEDYFNVDPSEIVQEEHLPSRQLLQYHLVSLNGLASLLAQTAQYCTHTYLNVQKYLALGNLVQHYLVILAISARVWYVCRSMCCQACNLYNSLYSCLDIVKATPVQWLPDSEELPADLASWIQEKFSDSVLPKVQSEMKKAATDHLENQPDKGWEGSDAEDLGVPVKRPKLDEGIGASSSDDKRDDPNNNASAPPTSEEKTGKNPYTAASSDIPKERKFKLKKCLKSVVRTVDTISDFESKLRTEEVICLGDECISLTNIGRKKILKKASILKKLLVEEECKDKISQRRKKFKANIAKMLAKYEVSSQKTNQFEKSKTGKKSKSETKSSIENDYKIEENNEVSLGSVTEKRRKKKVKVKNKQGKKKDATKHKPDAELCINASNKHKQSSKTARHRQGTHSLKCKARKKKKIAH